MRPILTDRVAWSVCRSVTLVSPARTAEPIERLFGLWTRLVQRNHVLDGGAELQIPLQRGNFAGWIIVKYRDCLLWDVQKRLNRSRCRLDVDSRVPKEACVTWDGHWRHLANTTEPSTCGGLLSHSSDQLSLLFTSGG